MPLDNFLDHVRGPARASRGYAINHARVDDVDLLFVVDCADRAHCLPLKLGLALHNQVLTILSITSEGATEIVLIWQNLDEVVLTHQL